MKFRRILVLLAALGGAPLWAQSDAPAAAPAPTAPPASAATGWQQCAQQTQDPAARLACYDRWVQSQGTTPAAT